MVMVASTKQRQAAARSNQSESRLVQDNATMKDGGLPSTGIPYVLVNGRVVVKESETVDDVFPGKPIHGTGKVA